MPKGLLRPGMTIIEATSGNTGIGLSLVGGQFGFRVVCVMPENVSEDRRKILHALGGETILTPAEESLEGCLRHMEAITDAEPEGYFVVNQFANPRNPEVHYQQTGPEIWRDLNGEVDYFVAGIGSGGTLQGIGKFLIEMNPIDNGRKKVVTVLPDRAERYFSTTLL
jgi:cysteine synthase